MWRLERVVLSLLSPEKCVPGSTTVFLSISSRYSIRLISQFCLIFHKRSANRSQMLTKDSLWLHVATASQQQRCVGTFFCNSLRDTGVRERLWSARCKWLKTNKTKSTSLTTRRTSKGSERTRNQQKGKDSASLTITLPEEGNGFDANIHLHLPAELRNDIHKHLGFKLSVLLALKQTYREALSIA